MAKLFKKSAIAIISESTQGTAASTASTDYIEAYDIDIKPSTDKLERNPQRTSLGPLSHMIGKRTWDVSFKTELKGSGSAGVYYVPLSAALAACGFVATKISDTQITFGPTNSAESTNYYGAGRSATIIVWKDGINHIVQGCMGQPKLTVENGKIAMLDFAFKGVYVNDPTDTSEPTQSPNKLLPPIVQNATLTVQGFSGITSKFDIDFGVETTEREDISSSGGVLGYQIIGYKPKISYEPEVPTLASHNVFNRLIAGTTGSATFQVGTVAGNRFQIAFPSVQYEEITYSDRGGKLAYSLPLAAADNLGNDSFSITAY